MCSRPSDVVCMSGTASQRAVGEREPGATHGYRPATGLRALVVEDAVDMVELVSALLRNEGFEVCSAQDGEQGLELARASSPDLVVLDLGLPKQDGVELCQRIRSFSSAYVLILTARSEEADKVLGLSVGADDYVTKPFSPSELVARVRAMLRRPRLQESDRRRSFGDLVIDPLARQARVGDQEVALTRTEFDLLDVLSSNPRRAFSRRQLIDLVWGPDWYGDDHVVDVHMSNLRRKLAAGHGRGHYVRTVIGVGYRMAEG